MMDITLNFINMIIPWLGIAFAFFAVLSSKVSTTVRSNAAFVHLSLLLWWLLVWADLTGDLIPLWQTTVSRSIVLAMLVIKIRVEYKATLKFIVATIGATEDET